MEICEKNKCTGCFSCFNVCPKNAINMIEDKYGYIYPEIDKEKCIDCGLCRKICPGMNEVKFRYPEKCYAGKVIDNNKLMKSTSGGIATAISEEIIKQDGVVYGATFSGNCNVEHIRVTTLKELESLKRSKYVHSYIKETYIFAKKDLNENKKVLFIGTPCQISGLKSFLMKEYDNLYTIDIICHGVPSQKFLKEEVKRLVNTTEIDRVDFRNKQIKDFSFIIQKNNEAIYKTDTWHQSPYYDTFMRGMTYRENCYSCKYAKPERCSDLTIGDFWGLNKEARLYKENKNGISVLLPLTEKGHEMIKMISDKCDFEERDVQEAVDGNTQLREPTTKDSKVTEFKNVYLEKDFFKTYKKVFVKKYYKEKIKKNVFVKKVLELKKGLKNGEK